MSQQAHLQKYKRNYMKKELEKILDILMLNSSGDVRITFLQGYVPSNKLFTALTILSGATKFSAGSFASAKQRWVITDTPASASKALNQFVRVLQNINGHHKISKKAYTLLAYMMYPTAIGLNRMKISRLLVGANELMTPYSAAAYLGLSPEEARLPMSGVLKKCPVCQRKLNKLQSSGMCTSCYNTLVELTHSRLLPISVPINYANFTKLINQRHIEDVDIGHDHLYRFKVQDGKVIVDYIETPKYYQASLPFEDYQKAIAP